MFLNINFLKMVSSNIWNKFFNYVRVNINIIIEGGKSKSEINVQYETQILFFDFISDVENCP